VRGTTFEERLDRNECVKPYGEASSARRASSPRGTQARQLPPEQRSRSRGQARLVTDPEELRRLSHLPLLPRVEGDKEQYVGIEAKLTSGSRLSGGVNLGRASSSQEKEHRRRLQ